MKKKIPKKVKINKKKLEKISYIILGIIIFSTATYLIISSKINEYVEQKEQECKIFEYYLNTEVLNLTTANVTDCICYYVNAKLNITGAQSNCACSCTLYDENGTLITHDFNPLFGTI